MWGMMDLEIWLVLIPTEAIVSQSQGGDLPSVVTSAEAGIGHNLIVLKQAHQTLHDRQRRDGLWHYDECSQAGNRLLQF